MEEGGRLRHGEIRKRERKEVDSNMGKREKGGLEASEGEQGWVRSRRIVRKTD